MTAPISSSVSVMGVMPVVIEGAAEAAGAAGHMDGAQGAAQHEHHAHEDGVPARDDAGDEGEKRRQESYNFV